MPNTFSKIKVRNIMYHLKNLFIIMCLSLSIVMPSVGCGRKREIKTEPEPSILVSGFQYIQDPETGLCFAYISNHVALANVPCTVCAKMGSCKMIMRTN